MTYTVKINSRGTITLPKKIRDEAHLTDKTKILITERNGEIIIKPIQKISTLGGSLKSTKKLSDEKLDEIKHLAFQRTKKA
jgi:AbrB family looped-hinge helix DNA binding protein